MGSRMEGLGVKQGWYGVRGGRVRGKRWEAMG